MTLIANTAFSYWLLALCCDFRRELQALLSFKRRKKPHSIRKEEKLAPQARHNGSPGREAWESVELKLSAGGAALIEDVFGIVFDAVFFQKSDEFILERHLAVVCLLIQNISLHCGQL